MGRGNAVADLMARGTVSSEIRLEMRRAMGICKSMGIRLEKQMNMLKNSELPSLEVFSRAVEYSLVLSRLVDNQVKLEKEARVRFQQLSREQVSEQVRGLMEVQLQHILQESMRGAKAKKLMRTGA